MTDLLTIPPPTDPTAIRILGVDPSLTGTGVCLPDDTTFTIKTKTSDADRRLVIIEDTIARIAANGVDFAVIEDLPTHAKSAGLTGMAQGVVRAALTRAGVPYGVLVPATLKSYAANSGNADKTAMAMAAYKRAGREFGDDNQCDAWWLAQAGRDWLGVPVVQVPAAQRERLAKGKWPTMTALAVAS